ncbi:MAG: S41 family peptidase [Bacteroidales bacterium]|nr:S41 family peptidase [Bacteroidales bacterium]
MKKFIDRLVKILPLFTILLMLLLLLRMCDKRPEKVAVNDHRWDKLMLILNQIEQHYVDSIDYKDIIEKTLPHIMQNLDPHSVYLPPEELEVADESLTGNFSGIGIQFNVPNDTVVVISVIPGGPSERAGLLSGDRIITVEGENIAGVKMPQDSIIKRLKGPRGTIVKVGVKRDDLDELVSFSIKRDNIPVKSVDVAYMINDTLGYMKLSKFARTSYSEIDKALAKLKEKGVKSLIFDLRDNSGGYLDQALLLSNEFLAKDELIVYMDGLHRKRQDFHADGRGKMQDVKLYVLINENSASSSEIFAGAIQDNDRGTIVGRRSFGKGLVQEPIYFTDKSGIRLTVARFYTPTGRCIQKPYSKDYQYDIIERYQHGEMTVADSIRRNDSLKFVTPKGKVVYGGGGIIPDIFVPIDTVGITNFLVAVNKKSLQVKYSIKLSDAYRSQLREVKDFEQLEQLIASIDIEGGFLAFAKANGIVPKAGEWQRSKEFIVTQIKGLFGRYSTLDDDAFYPYINRVDNVIERVIEEEKNN